MISFEKVSIPQGRTMAIVGDSLGLAIGTPPAITPALIWNSQREPASSNLFSSATNVAHATAIAATFAFPGDFVLTCQAGDAFSLTVVEIIVFPAAALNLAAIQYDQYPSNASVRTDVERRLIMRAIAMAATKAGAQAALEGGAATAATNYGCNPVLTGAAPFKFSDFGGTFSR